MAQMMPTTPLISTRFRKAGGTAKQVKNIRTTKMLSTARLFWIRQAVNAMLSP